MFIVSPTMATSINERKKIILDHERDLATRLASKVLDKPKPPLWIIFLPVFFIFFAQKMSQYKKGLHDFTHHHLELRLRAMDKALDLREQHKKIEPDHLKDWASQIPEVARDQYIHWMMVLVEHYTQLLDAPGNTFKMLVHHGYQSKTNYLLLCNCLNTAERAYIQALLPELKGDVLDLKIVVEKINVGMEELYRQDAQALFP